MMKHFSEIRPHDEDFLYRRLAAVCPFMPDGRDLEIALICDGDCQRVKSVAYAHGPVKDKWANIELSEGRVKVPRS